MHVVFGDCQLFLDRRELRRAGESVHLASKAFGLLTLLVEARPRALSKAEIVAALWPGIVVSDGSLAVLAAELRRALGDDARTPRYLRTVHGYGYAFCADADSPAPAAEEGAVCRLVVWGLQEFRLGLGEAVIGRDPACKVAVDLASLSRRHARLRIEPGNAVLEDLGSKNGCAVNGDPVTTSRFLADGDQIRMGSAVFSFHWLPSGQAADTLTSPVRSQ
jgi:DNA-binding winged helix-turn-helix (wHTH) protein